MVIELCARFNLLILLSEGRGLTPSLSAGLGLRLPSGKFVPKPCHPCIGIEGKEISKLSEPKMLCENQCFAQ